MIVAIGEILFDIFPEHKRLGGAPFNYSFHIQKMGQPIVFISRIGKDDDGKFILNFLAEHRFDKKFIQTDNIHHTGNVMVELDENGSAEFSILKNAAYDYIELNPAIRALLKNPPDLIYFGTVIQRTQQGSDTLNRLLSEKDPKTKCFCDINLRPDCYDRKIILSSLKYADILKLNTAEVGIIREMIGGYRNDTDFIHMLMQDYGIGMVCLTMGASGSVLYSNSDEFTIRIPKIETIVDTVGAGDAYAAMLTIGYLHHWHPARIVSTASRFASRICQVDGAIPLSTNFYDDFLGMIEEDQNER